MEAVALLAAQLQDQARDHGVGGLSQPAFIEFSTCTYWATK